MALENLTHVANLLKEKFWPSLCVVTTVARAEEPASSAIAADGSVSDGAGANPVTDYSIVRADSRDDALTMAKGCSFLPSGGSVEAIELLGV